MGFVSAEHPFTIRDPFCPQHGDHLKNPYAPDGDLPSFPLDSGPEL
jgi:hypothetical protein